MSSIIVNYNDEIRQQIKKIVESEIIIAKENKILAEKTNDLAQLNEKKKAEVAKLSVKLKNIEGDFIRESLMVRVRTFPGLSEKLNGVYIKIKKNIPENTFSEIDASYGGIGSIGKVIYLYYKAFSPKMESGIGALQYYYQNERTSHPSVLMEDDPHFEEYEKVISNDGIFIDGTAFGGQCCTDYFLQIVLFFISEKGLSYDDALNKTKEFYENHEEYNSNTNIIEELYDTL